MARGLSRYAANSVLKQVVVDRDGVEVKAPEILAILNRGRFRFHNRFNSGLSNFFAVRATSTLICVSVKFNTET
jgi:hypothetical protein